MMTRSGSIETTDSMSSELMPVEITGRSETQSGYSTKLVGSVTAIGRESHRIRICRAELERAIIRSGFSSSTSVSPSDSCI